MIKRPRLFVLLPALAAGLLACEPALQMEPADLTMLKIKVDDLERRLTKLEGQVSGMEPPALTLPTNVPDWVARGSGVSADDPNIIIGVGSITGVMNEAMARSNAEAAAKEEIAKIIRTSFETVRKRGGHQSISAIVLAGVKMKEHFTHPDGITYALALLNLTAHPQLDIKLKEKPPEPEGGDDEKAEVEKKDAGKADDKATKKSTTAKKKKKKKKRK